MHQLHFLLLSLLFICFIFSITQVNATSITLSIVAAEINDGGNYRCTATGDFNVLSQDVTLTVTGKSIINSSIWACSIIIILIIA